MSQNGILFDIGYSMDTKENQRLIQRSLEDIRGYLKKNQNALNLSFDVDKASFEDLIAYLDNAQAKVKVLKNELGQIENINFNFKPAKNLEANINSFANKKSLGSWANMNSVWNAVQRGQNIMLGNRVVDRDFYRNNIAGGQINPSTGERYLAQDFSIWQADSSETITTAKAINDLEKEFISLLKQEYDLNKSNLDATDKEYINRQKYIDVKKKEISDLYSQTARGGGNSNILFSDSVSRYTTELSVKQRLIDKTEELNKAKSEEKNWVNKIVDSVKEYGSAYEKANKYTATDSEKSKYYQQSLDKSKLNLLGVTTNTDGTLSQFNDKIGKELGLTLDSYEKINKIIEEINSNVAKSNASKSDTLDAEKIKETLSVYQQIKDAEINLLKTKDSKGKSAVNTEIERLTERYQGLSREVQNTTALTEEKEKIDKRHEKNLKATQEQIDKNSFSLKNMGERLKQAAQNTLQYSLVYKVLSQLDRAITQTIQTIKELDTAITNVRVVTGDTYETTRELVKGYSELAKELGATTTQVAEGSVEWLRQGKSAQETQELLKQSTILSKLGFMEAAEATEKLTATLNGYKLGADDAADVVDKLVKADLEYATSADEIATALQYVSSSGQLAGISLDKLIGMITVTSSVTRRSAETIGNSFRTIIARMQSVSAGKELDEEGEAINDVEKRLVSLGIATRDQEGNWRSISDVLDEIAAKWNTFSNVEQSAIATAVAGTRQRENLIVVMENYADVLEATEKVQNASGTSEKKYAAYMDSIDAKTNQLIATWENFVNNLNQGDTYKFAIEFLTNLISLLDRVVNNDATSAILKFTTALTAMVALNKGIDLLTTRLAEMSKVAKDTNSPFIEWFVSSATLKKIEQLKTEIPKLIAALRTSQSRLTAEQTALISSFSGVALTTFVAGVSAFMIWASKRQERLSEAAAEAKQAVESNNLELETAENNLAEIQDRIAEINAMPIQSLADKQELNNLKQESQQLDTIIEQLKEKQRLLLKNMVISGTSEIRELSIHDDVYETIGKINRGTATTDEITELEETQRKYGEYIEMIKSAKEAGVELTNSQINQLKTIEAKYSDIGKVLGNTEWFNYQTDKMKESDWYIDLSKRIENIYDNADLPNAVKSAEELIDKTWNDTALRDKISQSLSDAYGIAIENIDESTFKETLSELFSISDSNIGGLTIDVDEVLRGIEEQKDILRGVYSGFYDTDTKEGLEELQTAAKVAENRIDSLGESIEALNNKMSADQTNAENVVEVMDYISNNADKFTDPFSLSGTEYLNFIDELKALPAIYDETGAEIEGMSQRIDTLSKGGVLTFEEVQNLYNSIQTAGIASTQSLANTANVAQQAKLRIASIAEEIASFLSIFGSVTEGAVSNIRAFANNIRNNVKSEFEQTVSTANNLNTAIQRSTLSMDSLAGSASNLSSELNSAKSDIESLLDMTIKMLKQELETQKEALEEISKAKQEEFEKNKERIEEETEAYQKQIDAQLELLKKKKEEEEHQDTLSEKQNAVSEIQSELDKIALDDSIEAQRKRAELLEKLKERQKDLSDYQSDYDYEQKENALKDELDRFEEAQDQKLEALEKEYEAFEELQNQKIEAIDKQLQDELRLRQQAIALIEGRTNEFYNRLIAWNRQYGTHIDADVVGAWNRAYRALDRYGYLGVGVQGVLEGLVSQVNSIESSTRKAASTARDAANAYQDLAERIGNANSERGGSVFGDVPRGGSFSGGSNSSGGNKNDFWDTFLDGLFFGHAPKFHSGTEEVKKTPTPFDDLVGVRSDEQLAILKVGEKVIPAGENMSLHRNIPVQKNKGEQIKGNSESFSLSIGDIVIQGNATKETVEALKAERNNIVDMVFKKMNKHTDLGGFKNLKKIPL